jgi:signal transduction histidine kinase
MMRQQMRQHGIALELEAGEDLPPVRGDAVQLEQVLLNLLGNARDALLARDPADKWIRLRVQQGAALTVEIVVEDDAGGIDADPIERVFEPFFTTKPPGKGTGLGLSVSYGIVDALDGQMRVENTRVGARFTVRLPVWAGEEPTDRREAQRATPP